MAEGQEFKLFDRGDQIAGRFEVTERLGAGLLGATYLVRSTQSGKYLALKVLRPTLVLNPRDRGRFESAFETAQKIRHEKVVRYGEIVDADGVVGFTQEYFKSQSLRELIDEYQAEQKSFSLQEALQIVIQILEAADYLHEQGIIHRNLKPENVLVHSRATGPGGSKIVRTIKITDVGLTDILNPTIFAESYVNRDEARYLAPELSGFEHGGRPSSDVYSAGVMLYELLVGQTPRGTYLAPTQLRSDLPSHIDDIVEIALDANAEGRYPSARDMINDIQNTLASGDALSESGASSSFRNALVGAGVLALLLIGVGVYLSAREDVDPLEAPRIADAAMRSEVQANNRMPTEDEIRAMVANNPEMVYIPPGKFIMGRMHVEDVKTVASQSEPLAKVVEVAGFLIDRYEFPNVTKNKDGEPVKPASRATWQEAADACASISKRLCTAEEWEKACKGPANSIYSYGDAFDEARCGGGMDTPYHLGDHTQCLSGYGVVDMSGGLREWSATVAGSKGNRRVVKGGFKANNPKGSRCAFSVDESINYADGTLAFRCCLDIGEQPAAPEPVEGAADQ